jgi:hypothetical protein
MANYTFAQLEQLWINAGGPSSVAPVAAAIALAESSGNAAALNLVDNNGTQTSVGLWQVSNGTHNFPQAWLSPAGNAAEAVAKYTGAGNSFIDWGTYTSGAYTSHLSGSVLGATNAPGASGSGSTATAQAPSSGNIWTDITNPFGQAWKDLTTPFTGATSIVESVAGLGKDFNTLVKLFTKFMQDIEWLFVPSHWVRIFAFMFGIGALIPGVWALIQVGNGKQGDITLAIGILLITLAGVLLFVAFHNLPTTVTDLQGLLGYISQGIKTGQAPASGVAAGQLAPVPSGQLPAGG